VKRYVLSPDADQDLTEIWDYIAADSIAAADRWVGKLFDAFESLAQYPNLGHKREDLTTYPVLFWPVGSYLVIYRIAPSSLQIVAVTQGSRDIPAFLNQRFS
jgi:plasmid stabilization system protein ParE